MGAIRHRVSIEKAKTILLSLCFTDTKLHVDVVVVVIMSTTIDEEEGCGATPRLLLSLYFVSNFSKF